jgi:hypothetical protein
MDLPESISTGCELLPTSGSISRTPHLPLSFRSTKNGDGVLSDLGLYFVQGTELTSTPEPGALFLTATGLVGVWMKRRSHR